MNRPKYDPEVDILDVKISDAPIDESEEIMPGVIVDYDKDGNVAGLEIMGTSKLVKAKSQKPVTTKG